MKLEVGMYVRTLNGIERLKKENEFGWFFKKGMILKPDSLDKYIIKASFDIIDLIEVGDYVNGVMVESMNNSIKPIPIPQYKNECGKYIDFDESDIKSIVTHEQFSTMEYKLESEVK